MSSILGRGKLNDVVELPFVNTESNISLLVSKSTAGIYGLLVSSMTFSTIIFPITENAASCFANHILLDGCRF